jgi:hypothetical protein
MEWESDIIEHHEMSLTSLIHRNESLNTEKWGKEWHTYNRNFTYDFLMPQSSQLKIPNGNYGRINVCPNSLHSKMYHRQKLEFILVFRYFIRFQLSWIFELNGKFQLLLKSFHSLFKFSAKVI